MNTKRILFATTSIAGITIAGLLGGHNPDALGKGKPGGGGTEISNIAFAYVDGDTHAIQVTTIDGSQTLKVTNPPPRTEDHSPSWSPDLDPGTPGYQGMIAYLHDSDRGLPPRDLYVMNPDGTGKQIVKRFSEHPIPADSHYKSLAWSPNGREIVFSANGDALYAVEIATGNVRLLLDRPYENRGIDDPAISPLGLMAFFTDGDIYVVDFELDENGLMQIDPMTAIFANITQDGFDSADVHPSWSPDGTRIAFLSFVDDSMGFREYDQLIVYDFVLDQFTLVLEDDSPFLAVIQPSWSSDGSQIAIHAWFAKSKGNDSQWDIVRITNWDDATNRQVVRVTQTDRASEGYPQWSPGWQSR